jgi:chromate transporter
LLRCGYGYQRTAVSPPWQALQVSSPDDDVPASADRSAAHSDPGASSAPIDRSPQVGLLTIAREWGRIGCIGFGGPPAHIALLRKLCVVDRGWLTSEEFEDGVATTNLLPGPASTQLAIFCAWRLAGVAGALIGGACFIVPGLIVILVLASLFLATHPPEAVAGAAAGAAAAVPAVAIAAAIGLIPASWRRAGSSAEGSPAGLPVRRRLAQLSSPHRRWTAYLLAGGVAAALVGPFLVLLLAACGLTEMAVRGPYREPRPGGGSGRPAAAMLPLALAAPAAAGGLLAVAWVAFKVGALSYGGGFVIIPLMQHDAVQTYHWMTGTQFLSAVALGQITPGPVVQTVAVVGYAASGIAGGLLASAVAFAPSFAFVLAGGPRFATLRRSARVQAFLTGAGPAAIGAIAGAAISLGLELTHLWQLGVLALAAIWLVGLRKNVVVAIVGAACLGIIAVFAGAPVG